jgi:[ribosomal protein S18]-alanine N-acetyltransferase
MQEADLERVHTIDQVSFPVPWPRGAYAYEVQRNPASLCLVTETLSEEGERVLVGMLVGWLVIDEIHIATIAVDPLYRRRGIGRQLLLAGLREAFIRGASSATLEVRASNTAAQAMYRDFGFELVGRRHGYYQDNAEDALLMTLVDMDADYLEWMEDTPDESSPEEKDEGH